MKNVIDYAHQLLKEEITKNDIVIDMTVGNGNDTLFLVNYACFVYGFDIQKEACNITIEKLSNFVNYQIINDSHINFLNYVKEPFKAVLFNLGYLPKGNKNISTMTEVTLSTLKLVLKNIMINGICAIVVYPGHPEGFRESFALNEYLKDLNQKEYDVLKCEFLNQINNPPYLIVIRRKI